MRNGTTLTFGRGLKICIAISLCCYVALLGVIELTHDHSEHSHDQTEHCDSENSCIACFYNSLHAGVEVEPFTFVSLLPITITLPFYEAVFLPLRLPANTRSRAPPVFSNKLTNFAS
ncbi:MAG: hypothetical protein OXL96_14415 [Candidatus Poribacteria bacterium]|nr:hypothetical protein [Candidatus Poribacteria bacterium]